MARQLLRSVRRVGAETGCSAATIKRSMNRPSPDPLHAQLVGLKRKEADLAAQLRAGDIAAALDGAKPALTSVARRYFELGNPAADSDEGWEELPVDAARGADKCSSLIKAQSRTV